MACRCCPSSAAVRAGITRPGLLYAPARAGSRNDPLRESDGVSIEFTLTVYLHKRCPAQELAGGLDDCPSRPARIVVATGRTSCRLSDDAPFTIDLDSTICETYGLVKECARHHSYTGQRGYHPLLARAWTTMAGTGDVLMARLREGRANTVRGAAHFLHETVGRVRYGGARGSWCGPTAAAMPTPWSRSVERWMSATPSPSASAKACAILSRLYPKMPGRRYPTGWTAPPLWRRLATSPSSTPFRSEPDAAPVRLIVRRVQPTPGSQRARFANYSYHGCITDREGATLALEADHRRHAEIENAIRDSSTAWDSTISPRGASPPTAPGWRCR